MKIKELVKSASIPEDHWLTKATVKDEDVEIVDGIVVWKNGTWKKGRWENGIWKNGRWMNGKWEGGTWEGGYWWGGIWETGTWMNGYWENGMWENGYWEDGIWENGIWENGIWKNGRWENGTWECGRWENGIWVNGIWKNGKWENGKRLPIHAMFNILIDVKENTISIGCETRTVKEWDKLIKSNEPLPIERGSERFEKLLIAYKLAKTALKLERKLESEKPLDALLDMCTCERCGWSGSVHDTDVEYEYENVPYIPTRLVRFCRKCRSAIVNYCTSI